MHVLKRPRSLATAVVLTHRCTEHAQHIAHMHDIAWREMFRHVLEAEGMMASGLTASHSRPLWGRSPWSAPCLVCMPNSQCDEQKAIPARSWATVAEIWFCTSVWPTLQFELPMQTRVAHCTAAQHDLTRSMAVTARHCMRSVVTEQQPTCAFQAHVFRSRL